MYGLRIYGNQAMLILRFWMNWQKKLYCITMKRLKNFIEWNAFGVCTAIGDRLGIASTKIRQYFIYTSILTMGSPVIIYLVLAFWRNMRKYIWAAKRNPWYYL